MNTHDHLERPRSPPPTYPSLQPSTVSPDDDLRAVHVTHANTAQSITPYLGLPSRLSQIWLNRWTVLLLVVLARVVISLSALDDNIADAKAKALAACTKVEDVGSSMASMPHYLSLGVNELAASGVESAVRGMANSLDVAATGVEGLALFVVAVMTDTYGDLTAALAAASLESTEDIVGKFGDAANKTAGRIADGLETEVDALVEEIDKFVKDVQRDVLGANTPPLPVVDFSDTLQKLRDMKVDSSGFTSGVERIGANVQSYADVRNATERAISGPFETMRRGINESLASFVFDRERFKPAAKQHLTFCSGNEDLNGFFDGMNDTLRGARTAVVAVLATLALVAMAPAAWVEIKRWRLQRSHARVTERGARYDPLDVAYLSSRAVSATWGLKFAARFQGRKQVLVRWCVAYATSLPALFVLSLALAGLVSCLAQFVLLRVVKGEVPALAERVGDFAGDVVGKLADASKVWAEGANAVIGEVNEGIGGDVRGFVETGTKAVGDALDTFEREMRSGIEGVFGGTALKNATKEIVDGLGRLRTDAVGRGLKWLVDQAVVEFPRFEENMFSLGAQESIEGDSELTTFLASPGDVSTDEVTGAVGRVVEVLSRSILVELFVSLGLLMVYIIVVLVGVIRVLVGPDGSGTRGEGGAAALPLGPLPHSRSPAQTQDHTYSQAYPSHVDNGPFSDPYEGFNEYYSGGAGAGVVGGAGGEKYVSSVQAGQATRVAAHTRQSSYGDIGSTGKC
ncbi:related to Plasma membrane fusion protein PRM1 [Cephalotrichum gorgonifer]|uniref:Plasma membrane fusion protein PRM1 n=1 Tax=Cephalotrichum gorgonifer TaxID=2041049 RepID=A0AAE8N4X3_9PEZI|nr:related to Plasma membrane fusion protein PRM1 [Cephalotrichum gorgonifer]